MDVTMEMADDVAVLVPTGNLVASGTAAFHAQIHQLVADENRFILLDMSRISFMDSSGLDAIMTINKLAAARGGLLACAALQENVLKIFRITWADQKIPLAATRADGLKLLQAHRDDQG